MNRDKALELLEQEFLALSHSLGENSVENSPVEVIRRLKKSKFEIGDPNSFIREVEFGSVPHFDRIFLMKIPILLYPMQDHVFSKLNLSIEILYDKGVEPVILSIFPRQDYNEMINIEASLSANGKMTLSSDLFILFNCDGFPIEDPMSSSIGGKVKIESRGISIGDLNIIAQHSDKKAMWRFLTDKSINDNSELQVLILIGARSEVNSFDVNIEGSAQLSYDWLKFKFSSFLSSLPSKVKDLFFSNILDLAAIKFVTVSIRN